MSLIVAQDVRKSYATGAVEVKALRGVSFDVEAGSFLAFVGPSGSGKTTLLNLIGCLDKPSGGRLEVAGVDVTRLTRRQAAACRGEHIGFVFQSFNLIPVLTAFENVEYPLVMVQNRPASERRARVRDLLEAVGIALMKTMKQELNTTFLFSTHDTRIIGEVERIYTLEDGQLIGSEKGKTS